MLMLFPAPRTWRLLYERISGATGISIKTEILVGLIVLRRGIRDSTRVPICTSFASITAFQEVVLLEAQSEGAERLRRCEADRPVLNARRSPSSWRRGFV